MQSTFFSRLKQPTSPVNTANSHQIQPLRPPRPPPTKPPTLTTPAVENSESCANRLMRPRAMRQQIDEPAGESQAISSEQHHSSSSVLKDENANFLQTLLHEASNTPSPSYSSANTTLCGSALKIIDIKKTAAHHRSSSKSTENCNEHLAGSQRDPHEAQDSHSATNCNR